jgi:molybdopterin synthase sulfur carrier subunit
MMVKILGFGIVKDIFGAPSKEIELKGPSLVAGLKDVLETRFPDLKKLSSYAVAVNHEYAADTMEIKESDDVAIIPPVSGG